MHLYFLRHGKAEDPLPGQRDFDRRLTEAGRDIMRKEAKGMAALGLHWDVIYTSPLLRAKETAILVAEQFQMPAAALRTEESVASGNLRIGTLQTLLEGASADAHILLVGHEPDFSQTIGLLAGGAQVQMKRGSLAYVEVRGVEPGEGVLRWLLPPKVLEGLD